jgi:hypothetical protein
VAHGGSPEFKTQYHWVERGRVLDVEQGTTGGGRERGEVEWAGSVGSQRRRGSLHCTADIPAPKEARNGGLTLTQVGTVSFGTEGNPGKRWLNVTST